MASVSGVYLNCIWDLSLNEEQNDFRVWSVSVLYLNRKLNNGQTDICVWSVSELESE